MMFLGHDSGQYGYLCFQDGAPIPSESVAQRCGCSLEEYTTLLAELERACVPGRSSTGLLYSRRMVRDDEKRRLSADRQRKYKKKNKVSNAPVTQQKRVSNRDNEDENENEIVVKTVEAKKKASYEGVRAFCLEIQLTEDDADWVFNKWQGNGWKNDGKPIADWKATVRSWKRICLFPSQRDGNGKVRVASPPGKSIDELAKEFGKSAG